MPYVMPPAQRREDRNKVRRRRSLADANDPQRCAGQLPEGQDPVFRDPQRVLLDSQEVGSMGAVVFRSRICGGGKSGSSWTGSTSGPSGTGTNPGRTANKAREHLRAILSWAWEQELLDAPPRFPRPRPQRDVAGRHYLTRRKKKLLFTPDAVEQSAPRSNPPPQPPETKPSIPGPMPRHHLVAGLTLNAERAGFEPAVRFPVHSISSAAQSAALSPLPG